MKHILPLLLTAALALAGCSKSNPEEPSGTGGGTPTDSTVPTTPSADAEDILANNNFDRTIAITFSTSGNAAVEGDINGIVTVDGNHVTAKNTGTEKLKYVLSGTSTNGSFTIYSEKKQAVYLSGLSLTNPSGAALNSQSKKRCFLVLEGTNSLSDGIGATFATDGTEDLKGVVFSEGQIIVSGSGSLSVSAKNAVGKNAITSDDYVRVMEGPTLTVDAGTSAGHGIKGKDYVRISGGTLNVTTRADMKKGIISDNYVLVEGGVITVSVSGGTDYDSEDAEYKGSAGVKGDNYFAMTGGTLSITNTGNGGKGIHAGSYDFDPENHTVADSYITGGTITVSTSGKEVNDVSCKGVKIGWATKDGTGEHARVTANAGNLIVSGGVIKIEADGGEGLEAKGNLSIQGGELSVTSKSDDAINCQGQLDVTGGYVYAYSTANDALADTSWRSAPAAARNWGWMPIRKTAIRSILKTGRPWRSTAGSSGTSPRPSPSTA